MALQLDEPGLPPTGIFTHSEEFEQGGGKIRKGMGTFVVALDGSGDFDDIQEAIDALPSTGGNIFIKEGTYIISEKLQITKTNVSIIGVGRGSEIKTTQNITMIETSGSGDGFKLNNLKMLANSQVSQIGVLIQTNNCIVEGCWFENTYMGIQCEDVNDCIILGNHIDTGAGDAGIGIIGSTAHKRIIISSNTIYDCSNGAGIRINKTSDCIVNGNICRENFNGIEFGSTCSEIVITGNNCIDNDNDGIVLTSTADNNVINGNVCSNNGSRGIHVYNNTCDKNILIGNICLSNTTAQITDNGTNTHPNGASGTTNLALDDLNIIA